MGIDSHDLLAELVVPFPPSLNHYYRITKYGSLRISDEGLRYKHKLQLLSAINGRDKGEYWIKQYHPIYKKQQIKVRASCFYPDNRLKRDLDNLFKCLFDCVTDCGIWPDDSCVFSLTANKILLKDHLDYYPQGMINMEIYNLFNQEGAIDGF